MIIFFAVLAVLAVIGYWMKKRNGGKTGPGDAGLLSRLSILRGSALSRRRHAADSCAARHRKEVEEE